MNDNRVSTEQFGKAIQDFSKYLPPISHEDVMLINMNESLSIIQKFLITRRLKKIINKKDGNI